MRAADHLSNREARWLALRAQGLGASRSGSGRAIGPAGFRRQLAALSTVQLDAVNVLARTQLVVPFSRFGAYDPALLHGLTGPGRPWFEYWGHAASIQPVELYPLLRARMHQSRTDVLDSPVYSARRQAFRAANAGYLDAIRREVAECGPLAASQLSDPRRRVGEWWDRRSDGRRALEFLFSDGEVAAWRTPAFERVYDLPDRVIPAAARAAPVPELEEAQRGLLLHAARSIGVGTMADLADYFMIRAPSARARLAELVEEGQLVPVDVEGWSEAGYVLPGTTPRRPRRDHATVLSPFDSLIWRRERTERLFGFRYRIEIYVPAPKRTYGYYVLPVLLGDQLVGRVDLKTDRTARALLVKGAYVEDGHHVATVAQATQVELHALAAWLGLDRVAIAARGNLAAPLRKAVLPVSG